MTHEHPIYDVDKRFSIDPVTRVVVTPKNNKPVLTQFDHNSEHITFDCPRHVEGHDLALCDKVEIHYNNGIGRNVSRGVYEVQDFRIDDSDKEKVVFTWIISENATRNEGSLDFVVVFSCTDEGDLLYRWNTLVNRDLVISPCINNGEAVTEYYADVLELWKADLFGIGDTEEARMLEVSQDQQEAIIEKGIETIASIPVEYSDLYSNVDDLNTLLDTTIETPNLYKISEFDDNGYYNYSNGEYLNEMPDYGSSGFIEVKEGYKYHINASGYITFWDANKNFISGLPNGDGFVIPTGCKYVNCAVRKNVKYGYIFVEYGDVNYKILHSDITPFRDYFSVETNNLFDARIVGEGCYDLNGNFAYIDGYGSFTIPVTEGDSYIKNWSGYVSYFDSTNNWISATTISKDVNFVVPSGAVKMNVAILLTGAEFWLIRTGETYYKKLASDYLPAGLNGMRYGALGDSITYGLTANTCYGKIIADSEKLTFNNYGISGNRIANNDDEENDPMHVRYSNMNGDLDIITVFGGTNDYASQTPIGTNDDDNGDTFKGALNILCKGLLSKYIGKRLGFITPIHRSNENATIPLVDYVDAVKEICGLYGIPVLDLYNTSTISCVDDSNSNGLLTDGLHPSDAGHEVLARKIANFIKTL